MPTSRDADARAALVRELSESNTERLDALAARGLVFDTDVAACRVMLEVLLGDQLGEALLLHETRVAEQLDVAERSAEERETAMRRATLETPVPSVMRGEGGQLLPMPGRGLV